MEQMETVMFKKDEMEDLEESISAEGDSIVFAKHETEKSGRDYLMACSQNDQDERAHRAEVMKDAARIVIF
jgi:predicted HicB family RNase H-like nuclease